MITLFQVTEIMNKIIQLNVQAKQVVDQTIENILQDLKYWLIQLQLILIPFLENKINSQFEKANHNINSFKVDLQNQFSLLKNKQLSEKTNIIQILKEVLLNCVENIKQQASSNNDQKCIEIMQCGYCYPKMLQYQKNSQIFKAMRKKEQQCKQIQPSLTKSAAKNQHSNSKDLILIPPFVKLVKVIEYEIRYLKEDYEEPEKKIFICGGKMKTCKKISFFLGY